MDALGLLFTLIIAAVVQTGAWNDPTTGSNIGRGVPASFDIVTMEKGLHLKGHVLTQTLYGVHLKSAPGAFPKVDIVIYLGLNGLTSAAISGEWKVHAKYRGIRIVPQEPLEELIGGSRGENGRVVAGLHSGNDKSNDCHAYAMRFVGLYHDPGMLAKYPNELKSKVREGATAAGDWEEEDNYVMQVARK